MKRSLQHALILASVAALSATSEDRLWLIPVD